MNENKMQQLLTKIVEEEVPSQSVNLLGKMEAQVSQQKRSRNRLSLRWGLGLSLLLILGSIFVFTTPQGRVIADQILNFFIREDSDFYDTSTTRTAQAVMRMTGTPTIHPYDIFQANKTVPEIEGELGFDVLEPSWMPKGKFTFEGANLDDENGIAYQFWWMNRWGGEAHPGGMNLIQEQITDENCELCSSVGASAVVEEVEINGVRGEYVIGVWYLWEEGAVWENEPWLQRLRWQVDDMMFELLYMGPPEEIGKEDLLLVAESLY